MTQGARLQYPNFSEVERASLEAVPKPDNPPENFERILAQARGRARADGFEEGVAQAEARIDLALQEKLEAIERALTEMAHIARQAEGGAITSCCNALTGLLSAIAPHLLNTGAVNAITESLRSALETGAASHARIVVPLSALTETRSALERSGLDCPVDGRDDLPPGCARIEWRQGFDQIDLRPAIEAALTALKTPGAHQPHHQETSQEDME